MRSDAILQKMLVSLMSGEVVCVWIYSISMCSDFTVRVFAPVVVWFRLVGDTGHVGGREALCRSRSCRL